MCSPLDLQKLDILEYDRKYMVVLRPSSYFLPWISYAARWRLSEGERQAFVDLGEF